MEDERQEDEGQNTTPILSYQFPLSDMRPPSYQEEYECTDWLTSLPKATQQTSKTQLTPGLASLGQMAESELAELSTPS